MTVAPTRCSRSEALARRWSRPTGSPTCSTSRGQNRPDLYRLCAPKPAPLVDDGLRFGASERIGPEGVVEPLSDAELDRLARPWSASGAESVAVCLLFSYLDPAHERAIAARLRDELPGVHVSASHEVLPQFREYERCSTTVIDAYLSPLLGRYLGRLGEAAAERGLPEPLVMQSSGGVAPAGEAARAGRLERPLGPRRRRRRRRPARRACRATATRSGFDMGGTSCDVCVVEDGQVRRTDSREIGGRVIQLPMVDVHTVGAGGGSIGWRDAGGALRVGPALGRRRARARLLRARRHRADRHRRQPPARLPRRRLDAGRRRRARRRCRRARRSARLGAELGLDRARDRRGDRPGRQPGDGAGAAGRHRRAGHRPARLRADAVRRRRADARRRARRRARDRPDPLPARQRRPLGARAARLRAPPRHRAHGAAERRAS